MARREIIHGVMGAHKRGQLRASNGAPVKERRRAVAIAMSMAQRSGEAELLPSTAVSRLLGDLSVENPKLAKKVYRATDRQLHLPLPEPAGTPAENCVTAEATAGPFSDYFEREDAYRAQHGAFSEDVCIAVDDLYTREEQLDRAVQILHQVQKS